MLTALTTRVPLSATIASRALLPCVTTAIPRAVSVISKRYVATLGDTQDKVIILGAAGRDFHDFQTYYAKQPNTIVKCFTGTQIPGIDHRIFPKEMCRNEINKNLYPNGIQIHPENKLPELIKQYDANTCALAYSDLSYDTVQSIASRVNSAGCKFIQLPPILTMVPSTKPVIAICASRTGVGKSQTTRYVARHYKDQGYKVAVIRHPMPYDQNLNKQRIQRYETLEDLDKYECTIEEREEYYLHILDGNLLFAGVDYEMILHEAEKDADIILWDGGNNDVPFYKPDLHITLVDSLRPSDEEHYYPGETNVRMADAILVTKVNSLPDMKQADEHRDHLEHITKPDTPVFYGASVVTPELRDPATGDLLSTEEAAKLVQGKKVLVIDDGPTLTHGGMSFGAGYVLAKDLGAGEIVDPRPFAQGSLKGTFEKFTHLKNVLPAMGYGEDQIKDLEATIRATPKDTIIIGTPSDISHVIQMDKPSVVAKYNLEVIPEHSKQFDELLDSFHDRYDENHDLIA